MSTRSTRQLDAWRRSPEFREIARRSGKLNAARWKAKPRCGAKARTTDAPCRQPALSNGRCRYHGGVTPAADGWHKPRWPNRNAPKAEQKLGRKLRDLDRAARRRAARIARMTPAELERYEKWHAARKPGSKAKRAAERSRRDSAKQARERFSKVGERPANPEMDALAKRKAQLTARLRKLDQIELKGGVFE